MTILDMAALRPKFRAYKRYASRLRDGLAALGDEGVSVACSTRFDATRAFIRGDAVMPNHFVALKRGIPAGSVAGAWQSVEGATGVELDIYGVRFAFNLEPSPFGIPAGPLADELQAFWLGEETKGGVVPPCGADCIHVGQSTAHSS